MEVENDRTIRLGVACRRVDVHQQVFWRWWQPLQCGNDRDVLTVNHTRGDVNLVKNLVDVTNPTCDGGFRRCTHGQRHTWRIVVNHLLDPFHCFSLTHRWVQRQLGSENIGAIGVIVSLNRRSIPPLPRRTVEWLRRHTVNIVVQNRKQPVIAHVRRRTCVREFGVSENGVIVGGVSIDLFVYIHGPRHFNHRLVGRWNNQHSRLIGCERIVRALEAHHWNVAFVQPVQVTQCTASVHLEIKLRAVPYVVGCTQLEPSC